MFAPHVMILARTCIKNVRSVCVAAGAHDPPRAPVDKLQLIARDVCASMVMGAVETRQNLIWPADIEPVVGEQASLGILINASDAYHCPSINRRAAVKPPSPIAKVLIAARMLGL